MIPFENNEFYLRALVKYNDERALDDVFIDGQSIKLSDYIVANLYLGLRDIAGVWDVSVWSTNLFDEEALTDQRNPE